MFGEKKKLKKFVCWINETADENFIILNTVFMVSNNGIESLNKYSWLKWSEMHFITFLSNEANVFSLKYRRMQSVLFSLLTFPVRKIRRTDWLMQ